MRPKKFCESSCLANVVTTDRFTIDEPGCGSFDYLEAEVSTGHKLEHHVEHALRAEKVKKRTSLA